MAGFLGQDGEARPEYLACSGHHIPIGAVAYLTHLLSNKVARRVSG